MTQAHFTVGQLVQHKMFEYRGVVIDVDPFFQGSEEWYRTHARTSPPKDRPWYRVLVDGGDTETYVAERNLVADATGEPIQHPKILNHFFGMGENGYVTRRKSN